MEKGVTEVGLEAKAGGKEGWEGEMEDLAEQVVVLGDLEEGFGRAYRQADSFRSKWMAEHHK